MASAAFKLLLALSGLAGILIQCGVFTKRPDFSSLRYYTLISNALLVAYFFPAAFFALRHDDRMLPSLKGALTMGITVTGLVFHMLLSGSFTMGGSAAVANQLLHTCTPLMAVLDWLLFDEKGRYHKWMPLQWALLPDVYFVLATLYGFFSGGRFVNGSRFPYFFIDYDTLGVGRVLLNVLGLNLAFIALGYVFVAIDGWMKQSGSTPQ